MKLRFYWLSPSLILIHCKCSPPYAAYDEVYDYPMGFQPRPQEQPVSKQAVSAPPAHAVAYAPVSTESSLVTFLKTLKQMWDLYQAVISAWSSVAERHQQSSEQLKKERQEKQRLRQQQQQQQANKSRINSKKPQRGNGNKDAKPNQNKKAKTTTTTTSTSTSSSSSNSDEAEEATTTSVAIVNAVKANATADAAQESSERGMRHKREPEAASTDVGEGRYIKGDPLKGYYDFVITEGSYKFWAAFQVRLRIDMENPNNITLSIRRWARHFLSSIPHSLPFTTRK